MSIVKVGNPIVILPGSELREYAAMGLAELAATIDQLQVSPAARDHLRAATANWLPDADEVPAEFYTELFSAALLDTMEATSCWSRLYAAHNRTDAFISEFFELAHLDSDDAEEALNVLTRFLISNEVNERLCQYAVAVDGGRDNWRVWAVRPIGLDFAVEDIGDFRVLDWMRQRELKNQDAKDRAEAGLIQEVEQVDQNYISLLRSQQFQHTPLADVKLSRLNNMTQKKPWPRNGNRR